MLIVTTETSNQFVMFSLEATLNFYRIYVGLCTSFYTVS
jgi:hypothetical protein